MSSELPENCLLCSHIIITKYLHNSPLSGLFLWGAVLRWFYGGTPFPNGLLHARSGWRWARRLGWSLGRPGTGSVQLSLGCASGCDSDCSLTALAPAVSLLAQARRSFLSFPTFTPGLQQKSFSGFFLVFFFPLDLFWLAVQGAFGGGGKDPGQQIKDTKPHWFHQLWGADQCQKLYRSLSTFAWAAAWIFFLPFPETKGAAAILAPRPCGWVGGMGYKVQFIFTLLCLVGILLC